MSYEYHLPAYAQQSAWRALQDELKPPPFHLQIRFLPRRFNIWPSARLDHYKVAENEKRVAQVAARREPVNHLGEPRR